MLCPVCNGMQDIERACPKCGGHADDCGRLSDYDGPYAPYDQIEHEPYFSGSVLQKQTCCKHVIYCSSCHYAVEAVVTALEWRQDFTSEGYELS
ncbi:hypothetical protein D3C79_922400 [compost metagenome]